MIGPKVTIGANCKVQNNVSLYEGLVLEDDVFCGPSCVFTNVVNPRAFISGKEEFKTTLIKRGATIGANATVICGHTIGSHSFIAAGAVVTRDVPSFALMAGVPARRIGWMNRRATPAAIWFVRVTVRVTMKRMACCWRPGRSEIRQTVICTTPIV